mmetsp:Transcript_8380/g.20880  ORF Transcript_8380/g.20880 Transcript_8380/m.20880 type:complete len:109 (-) Transcript_8380:1292-1618(-)
MSSLKFQFQIPNSIHTFLQRTKNTSAKQLSYEFQSDLARSIHDFTSNDPRPTPPKRIGSRVTVHSRLHPPPPVLTRARIVTITKSNSSNNSSRIIVVENHEYARPLWL